MEFNFFEHFGFTKEDVNIAFSQLTERERKIFRLRYGIGDGYPRTLEEVGQIFNIQAASVQKTEKNASKKFFEIILRNQPKQMFFSDVEKVIEQINTLTPELMAHLKKHTTDLSILKWDVFEHLVAEIFAQKNFKKVSIVGRNPETGADIFAISPPDFTGTEFRYLIEVKRWRDKVGIETVRSVVGALTLDRSKWGYHVGMIVSMAGFTNFKSTETKKLKLLGIELRDGKHVTEWLDEYKFNSKGLWLPTP